MAVKPVPPMTDIPSFPALSDRAAGTYNSKAFAFGSYMADTFNGEIFAVASNVMENAADAQASAVTANGAAATAQSAADDAVALVGVNAWVSGTTYAKNVAVISQVNFQTYRRRVAGAGTVDPANDSTNWAMRTGSGAFIPQPAPSTSLNLGLGRFFTKTLNGNETLTFDNCPSIGYAFMLELTHVSGVLSLPSTVKTSDDIVYSLTPGKTHMLMFVTTNGGARWRMVIAPNYTN
jgi:hypothetical protein